MGQPNLGRRSGLSVGLLDWMAGLGCDPRRYRMEASTRACVARAGSPAAGTVSGPRAASRADFCSRADTGPGMVLAKLEGTTEVVPRVLNLTAHEYPERAQSYGCPRRPPIIAQRNWPSAIRSVRRG